jgi:two-component system, NarL family, nitrate/nitrite response regulator NarL
MNRIGAATTTTTAMVIAVAAITGMAETARMPEAGTVLRVAVRAGSPAHERALANIVRSLGHSIVGPPDADVALTDDGIQGALEDIATVMIGGMDSNAAGLLPIDASAAQIDAALRAAAAGLAVRVRSRDPRRFSALEENEAPSPLTPRELEVLIALSEGLSNKAIARRFDISQHTVKFHAESIFRKLHVATRAEAVAKGLRRGLVHL